MTSSPTVTFPTCDRLESRELVERTLQFVSVTGEGAARRATNTTFDHVGLAVLRDQLTMNAAPAMAIDGSAEHGEDSMASESAKKSRATAP